MKYQTKTEIVEATQWFKNGDHPLDDVWRPFEDTGAHPTEPREGKVVRYFRHPNFPGEEKCYVCGKRYHDHGWIDCGSVGLNVCPGDFVATLPEGGFKIWTQLAFEKHHTLFKSPDSECLWKPEGDGNFRVTCTGLQFGLDAVLPSDVGFHFCPNCGKKVIIK